MFHVEFRRFPNVARLFNLTREELDGRVLRPWVAGRPVEVDGRRWPPDRARLLVIEGRRLEPEEIGLGRGWANAIRTGQDVTARLLDESAEAGPTARPAVEALKGELLDQAQQMGVPLHDAFVMASRRHSGWRVSDRLALAETAVWELLHQRRARLVRAGAEAPPADWGPVLLTWDAWCEGEVEPWRLALTCADGVGPAAGG